MCDEDTIATRYIIVRDSGLIRRVIRLALVGRLLRVVCGVTLVRCRSHIDEGAGDVYVEVKTSLQSFLAADDQRSQVCPLRDVKEAHYLIVSSVLSDSETLALKCSCQCAATSVAVIDPSLRKTIRSTTAA